MNLNINREFVNVLETLARHAELRRLLYAAMALVGVWKAIPALLHSLHAIGLL